MNESNEIIKILLLNGNAGDGITSLINVFFGKSFNDIDGISTLNPYFLEGQKVNFIIKINIIIIQCGIQQEVKKNLEIEKN